MKLEERVTIFRLIAIGLGKLTRARTCMHVNKHQANAITLGFFLGDTLVNGKEFFVGGGMPLDGM